MCAHGSSRADEPRKNSSLQIAQTSDGSEISIIGMDSMVDLDVGHAPRRDPRLKGRSEGVMVSSPARCWIRSCR